MLCGTKKFCCHRPLPLSLPPHPIPCSRGWAPTGFILHIVAPQWTQLTGPEQPLTSGLLTTSPGDLWMVSRDSVHTSTGGFAPLLCVKIAWGIFKTHTHTQSVYTWACSEEPPGTAQSGASTWRSRRGQRCGPSERGWNERPSEALERDIRDLDSWQISSSGFQTYSGLIVAPALQSSLPNVSSGATLSSFYYMPQNGTSPNPSHNPSITSPWICWFYLRNCS